VTDSNDDPEKASASIHTIALARSNDIDEKDQHLGKQDEHRISKC
jgi:hypothetical protein